MYVSCLSALLIPEPRNLKYEQSMQKQKGCNIINSTLFIPNKIFKRMKFRFDLFSGDLAELFRPRLAPFLNVYGILFEKSMRDQIPTQIFYFLNQIDIKLKNFIKEDTISSKNLLSRTGSFTPFQYSSATQNRGRCFENLSVRSKDRDKLENLKLIEEQE